MSHNARRSFLKASLTVPALAAAASLTSSGVMASTGVKRPRDAKLHLLKTSLNAFSFNDPLKAGAMTIDDMIRFCSDIGFDGVDLTAYYFPGYPAVPSDELPYKIKRDAFLRGVGISGTGVRNDFTDPDKKKRAESVELVKNWIIAAEKIGAPVIRIFAGVQDPQGYSRAQVIDWIVEATLECVAFGEKHGVVVALQNHYDFIKVADDVVNIAKRINSKWFGVILDTGSYRIGDPYSEIEKTLPYAVNWQVKEKIWIDGKEVDTDLERLVAMIKAHDYRGYLPIETLGAGDPKQKISIMLSKFRTALNE
jgi:sugar phosphate isomerase/epimerase